MIPKECKRRAERDTPFAVLKKRSVWEKPILHGHNTGKGHEAHR
jgi:hypothetical protein